MARLLRFAASSVLVLLALVSLTSHVSAQCSYNGVDLSSLMSKDWTGTDGGTTFSYTAHVCAPVSRPGACTQNGVPGAACQIVAGQGAAYLAGFWQNPQWSTVNNGVQYTLQGANTCRPNGFAQKYTATFVFLCSDQQDAQFTVVPGLCAQTWTMHTPAACGGGSGVDAGAGANSGGLTRSATIGIVVGSVVGGLLLIAAAGVLLWWCARSRAGPVAIAAGTAVEVQPSAASASLPPASAAGEKSAAAMPVAAPAGEAVVVSVVA